MNELNVQTLIPTKVLLGWLTKEEGCLWLAGRDPSKITPEMTQKVLSTKNIVEQRPFVNESENPFTELPEELSEYISEFWNQPGSEAFKNENWSIKIVDLTKVRAAQPSIAFEKAKDRTKSAINGNIVSIANLTLPKHKEHSIPLTFDASKNAWVVTSTNPNLRICANINSPLAPGITAIGFGIELANSFVQVAECDGHFILRDGYHRAFGLLSNGISKVPVLTKKFSNYSELRMPAGLITHEELFGKKPPYLIDYLNDDVTSIVYTPVSNKTIIIQGLELLTT